MEKFTFEKLDIYKRAVEFAITVRKICKISNTDYEILDQLKRAALSISLNLAEGSISGIRIFQETHIFSHF